MNHITLEAAGFPVPVPRFSGQTLLVDMEPVTVLAEWSDESRFAIARRIKTGKGVEEIRYYLPGVSGRYWTEPASLSQLIT